MFRLKRAAYASVIIECIIKAVIKKRNFAIGGVFLLIKRGGSSLFLWGIYFVKCGEGGLRSGFFCLLPQRIGGLEPLCALSASLRSVTPSPH